MGREGEGLGLTGVGWEGTGTDRGGKGGDCV